MLYEAIMVKSVFLKGTIKCHDQDSNPRSAADRAELGSGQIDRLVRTNNAMSLFKGCQSDTLQHVTTVKPGITSEYTIQPGKWQPRDHLKGMQLYIFKYQVIKHKGH